jgi:hypothetical protein
VLLTMRADLLDIAVNRLGLGEVARNSVFLVTPMTAEQMRAAIVSSAERQADPAENSLQRDSQRQRAYGDHLQRRDARGVGSHHPAGAPPAPGPTGFLPGSAR